MDLEFKKYETLLCEGAFAMLLHEERTPSADNFKKKLDKKNKMGSIMVQFVFKASFHLRGMYSRQRWDLSYSSKKPENLG